MAVYHIFFWAVGGAHSLSWDYLPGVPQGEEAEQRVSWKEKPVGGFIAKIFLRQTAGYIVIPSMEESDGYNLLAVSTVTTQTDQTGSLHKPSDDRGLSRIASYLSTTFESLRSQCSPASGIILPTRRDEAQEFYPPESTASSPLAGIISPVSRSRLFGPKIMLQFFSAVSAIITPITFTIAVSVTIALVQPLKNLFVETNPLTESSWKGPDGRPPLAFVIDTARFVGSIYVPMVLVLLGASFGRLRIPRPISRLPISAILSTCLAKMVVLPVIGVILVQALVKACLIPKQAKVELFVAMFMSGTPSALKYVLISSAKVFSTIELYVAIVS
jgi:auxin efflux carrier family protein